LAGVLNYIVGPGKLKDAYRIHSPEKNLIMMEPLRGSKNITWEITIMVEPLRGSKNITRIGCAYPQNILEAVTKAFVYLCG
jgi:hypothetical protein